MRRKKIVSMLLAATMTFALATPAFAEGGSLATWFAANKTEKTTSTETQSDATEESEVGFFESLFKKTASTETTETENSVGDQTKSSTSGDDTQILVTGGMTDVITTTPANSGAAVIAEGTDAQMKLWYDEPAPQTYSSSDDNEVWKRATLPIGNGIIGANVYGTLATEHLTVNEETLWSGGRGSVNNYNGGNPAESRVSVYEGYANTLLSGGSVGNIENLRGVEQAQSGYNYGYQALGDLYFAFTDAPTSTPTDYVRSLDVENAEAAVSYTHNNVAYTRTYFTSNPDNVLVSRLAASAAMGEITVSFNSKQQATKTAVVTDGVGYITVAGTVENNGLLHDTQIAIVADAGTVTANAGTVTVSGATAVTVYLTSATDYENTFYDDNNTIEYYYRTGETAAELNARVKAVLTQAVGKGYEAVQTAHRNDYHELYNRVELNLGQSNNKTTDALLSAYQNNTATDAEKRYMETLLFQYGRYLLIAGSRDNCQIPANLQGIWNNSNAAPWYADIHTNINIQMNYWLSNACNLTECALPLVRYVKNLEEPGGRTVEIYTGAQNGIMAHTQNTPFGYTSPGYEIGTWGWSPAAATWMMQNCYDYYEYSKDIETLRNDIYPILREQVLMYEELLKDYNGRKVMPITLSPELSPITAGNTFEQSLIWQLYADTIEAAKELNADSDLIGSWETTMAALKPIEIGQSGQVKEWYTETTINSVVDTSGHRHLSNLLGLYPGNLFDTEELEKAAIVSLNNKNFGRVGTNNDPDGGWTYGQLINSWARVNNGENAYYSVEKMIKNRLFQNLWDYHSPNFFQIDANYGYSAGVAEMLVQSNLGYIELLPALPEAWKTGSVRGLLTEGNFEVDMTWSEGKLTTASVLSNNGGECSIKAMEGTTLTITDGAGAAVTAVEEDGIYTFATTKGAAYTVASQEIPKVENLKAVRNEDGHVILTWNAKEGVTYQILRKELVARSGETVIVSDLAAGTYTDTTAVADKEYEYTVTGSDGSVGTKQVISLSAILETVFVKLTGTEAPPAGNYIIVNALRAPGQAIGNTRLIYNNSPDNKNSGNLCLESVTIENDVAKNVADKYIWKFTKTDDKYAIETLGENAENYESNAITAATGTYLKIQTGNSGKGLQFVTDDTAEWTLVPATATANTWALGNGSQYINSYKDGVNDNGRGVGTWESGAGDTGSRFYLYGEQYKILDSAIAELTADVGAESGYTPESWSAYEDALTEASAIYSTEAEAQGAYLALEEAMDALVSTTAIWADIVGTFYKKEVPTNSSNTDTTIQEVPSGIYLIVGSGNHTNKAIKTSAPLVYSPVTISGDKITESNEELEWKFTWNGNGYTVESVDDPGKYLHFTSESSDVGVTLQEADSPQSIQLDYLNGNGGVYEGTVHVGTKTDSFSHAGYLNNRGTNGIGTYDLSHLGYAGADNGSSYFLYRKVIGVFDDKIAAVTANVGAESDYTAESWAKYNAALTKVNGTFETGEAAYLAYVDFVEKANDLVLNSYVGKIKEIYVKVTPEFDKESVVKDGIYVIRSAHNGTDNLIKSEISNGGFAFYTGDPLTFFENKTKVSPVNEVYEWEIVNMGNGAYAFVAVDGDGYMSIPSGVAISSTLTTVKIAAPNAGTSYVNSGGLCIGNGTNWLNWQTTMKTWTSKDAGSSLFLFKRMFAAETEQIKTEVGTDGSSYTQESWNAYQQALTTAETGSFESADDAYAAYQALETAKEALQQTEYSYTMEELYTAICAANGGKFLFSEECYTRDSGIRYRDALKAARQTFATKEEAEAAMAELIASVENLKANTTADSVFPMLTWEVTADRNRTVDDETTTNIDETTLPNYVPDVDFMDLDGYDPDEENDSNVVFDNYEALTWEWNEIKRLVNDEDERVYPVWGMADDGMFARRYSVRAESAWQNANVYKISGQFAWPEGYKLSETTIVLDSVNDFFYRDIYEYLSENGMSEYYPLGQVFPVNDDVYVVLWAETEENGAKPTVDNINDYLAFWTGTTGKGIWSYNGWTHDDWGRTEPATFIEWNLQGERAFHSSYPNMVGTGMTKEDDTAYTNSDVAGLSTTAAQYLSHTDQWYTMADTTAVNSVMRSNYTDEQMKAGTIVHVDLYVMNNSGEGMIDQLEIELFKQKETDTTVTVNYYLNEISDDCFLGSETMLNQKYGTEVILMPGVGAAQLNSYKAEAIAQAGYKDVTNGVQLNAPLVVTRDGENVIDVLYTLKGNKTVILTAPSAEYVYDGTVKSLKYVDLEEIDPSGVVKGIENGTCTLPDGNTIHDVYSHVEGTEPGKYINNFMLDGETLPIYIKDGDDVVTNSYSIVKRPGELTITTNTVDEVYVYDFGVANTYTDVLKFDVGESVAETLALEVNTESTNVTFDKENNTITYTPSSVNTGETVELELVYTGGYTVTKTVQFVPASNVLYEENFMTITPDAKDDTPASWSVDGTAATKVVEDNDGTVYGYTGAYAVTENYSNGSALKATLGLNDGTGIAGMTAKTRDAMTFTFEGTGFDLISKCGKDTGMLIVKVVGAETGTTKAYLVDTYFTGDANILSNASAYQVPVVRALGLPHDQYTVTVHGYLINTAGAMTVSLFSNSTEEPTASVEEMVKAALEECGMEDVDVSDVEVSYMDDNSVLNGGSGNVSTDNEIVMFAAEGVEGSTATAEVYVDGFRVYQPLEEDTVYATGEQGTTYRSVFDFAKTSVNDLTADAMLYMEYDGNTGAAAIADYKTQGPQNEVYLTGGSAVAFALDKYTEGNVVQIGAKAVVAGAGLSVDGSENSTNVSATEMYYNVPVQTTAAGVKYVLIKNTGAANTVLALSGLKVSNGIGIYASGEVGEQIINGMSGSDNAETVFEITTAEKVQRDRRFTVSVETSTDVKYVRVVLPNGVSVDMSPYNAQAVASGAAKTYKYSHSIVADVNWLNSEGKYTFTTCALDADKNAISENQSISIVVE